MYSDYTARLSQHYDELKWLYCELYHNNMEAFQKLIEAMARAYQLRPELLKASDRARAKRPDWYKGNDLLGMCLYVKQFGGTLQGVQAKLDYLRECGVNYLHLMPLLDTVDERSDGGYAVASFRKVKQELGTMADLEDLTAACHERGISCCLDFVMNHTSEDHEWAKRARAGEREYQDYYFFYEDRTIPDEYEKYVPQVFPTTAPGNFTYLEDVGKWVLTSFYPYQWDLDYRNPAVFHAMTENLLYLANRGIDIIRIDAVPYIWKELGTDCRNRPQVHTIVRMIRMICEVVCPGTLLLGEVVMAPEKLAPYFGPVEKPECHMLYNATTMCTLWHTVATRDTRLLRHQLKQLSTLPKEYSFLNYIRCHDDIGWGLDYPFLQQFGMQEVPHKAYLNAFFCGETEGSFARGERYNDDPRLGDARLCGTTASLVGLETAKTNEQTEQALRLDLMLHAFILAQSGVPILYSGDEVGQRNDYSYHNDPKKAEDSRYLHRGDFRWDKAQGREDPESVEGRLYNGLLRLEALRRSHGVFSGEAELLVEDPEAPAVLKFRRVTEGEKLTAVYNFSETPRKVSVPVGRELVSGGRQEEQELTLPAWDFVWILEEN